MWKELLDRLFPHAHRKVIAYPTFLIVAGALAYFFRVGPLGDSPYVVLGVPLFVFAGLIALHTALLLPPRIRKGAVGVGFAVVCEDEDERRLFRSDFVEEIKRALLQSLPGQFHVIELPDRISRTVADGDSVAEAMERSGLHFLVHGHVRRGTQAGKEWHALRLTCTVRHTAVEVARAKWFSTEMAHVLPRKVLISCENDLAEFELRSGQYADGARLVIGTAALISGDISLATEILEALWADSAQVIARANMFGTALPDIVRRRLWNCYIAKAQLLHFQWRSSRDTSVMVEIDRWLERANDLVPNTTEYFVEKAICHFVLRRDVAAAEAALLKIKKVDPAHACFGLAFLKAYTGDLQAAWRLYREAFRAPTPPAMPVEIEEFMAWILEGEPDKVQLFYCLGIMNWKSKGDVARALSDFEEFLSRCPPDRFNEARDASHRYVAELKILQRGLKDPT